MRLFGKKKKSIEYVEKTPEGFRAEHVVIKRALAGGGNVIGFLRTPTGKLEREELCRNDADIQAFFDRYSLKRPDNIPYK